MVNITLRNGDCFELLKEIESGSVDLIVTDPPYWHKKSPGKPYSQRKQPQTNSLIGNSDIYNWDGEMIHSMSDFTNIEIELILNEFERIMKKMNLYIFCSDVQVPYYGMWAETHGYRFTILVWEKPNRIINHNRYSQNVEYIVRIYDLGTALNFVNNNDFYSKVKKVSTLRGESKIHPTQKPLELIEPIIALSSNEDSLILDPFMGSGSVGVVCKKMNRNFIGMELNKKYFDSAKKRIETFQNFEQIDMGSLE